MQSTTRPPRRWTVIIVPAAGTARTRTLVFSLRRMAIGTAAGTLTILAAAGWGGTGSLNREAERARGVTEQLQRAGEIIRELRDSIQTLEQLHDRSDAGTEAARADRPAPDRSGEVSLEPVAGVILPVEGRITSGFGSSRYHPLLEVFRPHRGVDVSAPAGTPIHAPAAGRVSFVGWRIGEGLVIELDHGGDVISRYAHCRKAVVDVGDVVRGGGVIGKVGMTGLATGPHVHFEVLVRGRHVDPLRYALVAKEVFHEQALSAVADDDLRF
jgi:murein DD-endopeptidase MepM/ murein hydrolase activator NlpD